MKREDHSSKPDSGTNASGEEERDNDAHRPDGSTGTAHDSTAQKTARGHKPQNGPTNSNDR